MSDMKITLTVTANGLTTEELTEWITLIQKFSPKVTTWSATKEREPVLRSTTRLGIPEQEEPEALYADGVQHFPEPQQKPVDEASVSFKDPDKVEEAEKPKTVLDYFGTDSSGDLIFATDTETADEAQEQPGLN